MVSPHRHFSFFHVAVVFFTIVLFMSVPSATRSVDADGKTVAGPLPIRAAVLAKSAAPAAAGYTIDSARALSEINAPSAADAYPFISGDGLSVYFIKDISGYTLYYATRTRRDTLFGPAAMVPGLSGFNTATGCWLTNDALTVFYTTSDGTLYRASRAAAISDFSAPQTVTLSGAPSGFKSGPSLTPDLNELYIYSGSSGKSIVRCVRVSDYQYSYVDTIATISTPGIVAPGQLSKDGLKFYLGIKPSTSSYDAPYVFTRASLTSPWDSGSAITAPIGIDYYQLSVTADEKELFYVSGGSWSGNDLWVGKLKTFSPLQLVPIASPTYNRRPDFQWYKVPGAAVYTLQIASDPGFASGSLVIAMPLNDTIYLPQADLPAGAIYWRVKADNTNYSTSTFVILDNRVPMIIPYLPKMTLERRPVLKWHPVSGASSYTLLIDDYYNFLTPIITVPIQAPDTSYTCLADLPYGPICWKVQSNLVATFSNIDTFQLIPDSIPYLWRFNGAVLSQKRPAFRWHPVPNSDAYTIDLSTSVSFTTHIFLMPVPDTSYTPLIDLTNGKYFWRVSSSRNGIFSAIDTFSVSAVSALAGPAAAAKRGHCAIVYNRSGILVDYAIVNGQAPTLALHNLVGTIVYAARMESSCGAVMIPCSAKIPAGTYVAVVKAGAERYQCSLLLSR